ncbi:terminase small subunit [Serratia fonticola]|uniref:terminase small subunit n=1 Tax=Serratia fonticola TaxID=47917 RepID=UPI0027F12CD3|nr:terminase small subunit [Serratia fonticola]MDQ7209407.1 terminase small subunit [Serratia fonticola]HBE9078586.1 terminase small subunit [Serratia fonticola]HBE9089890.1 terminase small subunit [Serratia fonticola]
MTLTKEQKALFDALTALQKKFVTHLIKGKNQTDAYKAAGGKAKTDDSARNSASKMFTNVGVQAFLQSVQYEAVSEAIMTRTEALERLTVMGRARVSDLVDFSEHKIGVDADTGEEIIQAAWRFKDSVKQHPELLDAIAEVTAGKEGIKLKLHDSRGAIKQIGEMQGWEAPKKTEVSGPGGGAIQTETVSMTPEEAAEAYKNMMG